ncbi:MAG: hypothetical protein Q8P59_07500, partial [Dehalococcoidia bacterium]|nr:hypothetical protein [Dehalococcoidia bacterium]
MAVANPNIPSARMPQVPRITSVEQILPAIRLIVKRKPHQMVEGLDLKAGEKVLILSDSTISPLLTEAFTMAIKEAGGCVETITLEGY